MSTVPAQRAPGQPPSPREPRVRVCVEAGRAPLGGVVPEAFSWRDVLREDPPWGPREPPGYCVPAPETSVGAWRVENVVLVRAEDDRVVEIEDRLVVGGRLLGRAIEAERAVVGAAVDRHHAQVERRARRTLRKAERAQEDGGAHGVLVGFPLMLAHAVARGWAATLRGARRVTRGLTAFPDRVALHGDRSRRFLSTPEGRAKIRRGLVEPDVLTAEEKAITLFTGTGVLLLALLAAHFAVTLSVPHFASTWRSVFFLFLYAYVTSLGIPIPIEPVLFGAALVVGKPMALVVTVLAKACAAWMIFFVGDAVHHRVVERTRESPRWAAFVAWSERFAERFGTFALALFIATPGLPDTVALYLFGALHMRMWQFVLGVAIGSTILNGVILYGAGALFGF